MPETHDVIVVGLGAMGSAALYHLARRGKRALGFDRFAPPHTLGSSHGESRIIREAYFEHPLYVPLLQRAYELWADLGIESGRPLFRQTGGLTLGRPDGVVFPGSKRSVEMHALPHEILSAAEVRRRFPALEPDAQMQAVWEPRAGALFPEACVESHLALAQRHGAKVRVQEVALRWAADGEGVKVVTDRGEYSAEQLLLTAGPWVGSLLPDRRLPLKVERQIMFWFEAGGGQDLFSADRLPVHIWEYRPGKFFYGFPDLGTGIKVARHHEGEPADPDRVRREVSPEEVEAMRAILREFLPAANGALRKSATCLYTNTPDEHFLIDFDRDYPQVLIGSPCSGHGFKFSSVMGEILADLLSTRSSRFDLSLFRNRWPSSPPRAPG